MKTVKLLSYAVVISFFASCDTFKQATNTTGGAVFSLNGAWKLNSNIPENTLVNSKVTVTPFIARSVITALENNTQCYRQNDVKWKNIKSNNQGGYSIDNATSNCTAGTITYLPANITVVNNNEIKIITKNAAGIDNAELWTRVK